MLWVHSDRWTASVDGNVLGQVAVAGSVGWESGAGERLRESLAEQARCPIVVALESDLCLPFAFQTASRRQARSRDLVAYQIEEPLPIAAEEIVADYVAEGVRVFGVGADRRMIEGFLGELRGAGLDVRCVVPGALLAASQLAHEHKEIQRSWWVRPDGIEQVAFNGSGPSHWRALPREAEPLRAVVTTQGLAGEAFEAQAVIASGAADRPLGADTAELIQIEDDDPCLAFATRAAQRLVRGETTAPIDLVRGLPLGSTASRDPMRWDRLAVAAGLLLVVLVAAAWRGAVAVAAERELQQLADAEVEVFVAALPDARVPRGVRTRLESELRSLAGTRADLSDLPEHANAALRLESVLGELPSDLRFRVLEIRIESGRLFLLGEARDYSDVDRIATSLRRSGLVVSPPSSRQLADKGVEFRLAAEEPVAEEPEETPGRNEKGARR